MVRFLQGPSCRFLGGRLFWDGEFGGNSLTLRYHLSGGKSGPLKVTPSEDTSSKQCHQSVAKISRSINQVDNHVYNPNISQLFGNHPKLKRLSLTEIFRPSQLVSLQMNCLSTVSQDHFWIFFRKTHCTVKKSLKELNLTQPINHEIKV